MNPAVQFSLLVMMYISIFPIAFSIRTSNTYEETSIGKYAGDDTLDESQKGTSYLLTHARNQLSFDLWWIMLGVFLIVIAESDRVADNADPAFSVFAILFEVVSGYGNVGLSLGYPTVMTSLSGKFGTFSKLVICAMMIRGRHRGLPYGKLEQCNSSLAHCLITLFSQLWTAPSFSLAMIWCEATRITGRPSRGLPLSWTVSSSASIHIERAEIA